MSAFAIKEHITPEMLFQHYGAQPDSSRQRWRCLFPERHNHGDQNPSVSFYQGTATCHSQRCFRGDDIFSIVGKVEGVESFQDQKRRIEEIFHLSSDGITRQIVATYDYEDELGNLLFQVVRFAPKAFRQRRPDGQGGWVWGLGDTRRVLYQLPDLVCAESVLLVEGERDVECAYGLGLPAGWAATTCPMGAGKWSGSYSESLRGKDVVVCPDDDDPGKRHGELIAQQLQRIAKEVRWLELPSGKDLSQWAEQGGNVAEFHGLLESASDFYSSAYRETEPTEEPSIEGIKVLTWGDFLDQSQEEENGHWIIDEFLRPGWLVACIGHGKEGKTTLLLHLMASLSLGTKWTGRDILSPIPTIYLGFEMHPQDLRSLIAQVSGDSTFTHQPHIVLNWPAPLNLDSLRDFLKSQPRPGVLVLDSFRGAFMLGRDGEKDAGVTGGILRTLQRIARDTNWTILVIHHSKKSGTGEFLDGSGSGEWLAVPDAVWTWTRPRPTEPGILRVTGRMPPIEDVNISLTPKECQLLGTVQEVRSEQKETAILEHLPGPDGSHKTIEDILKHWGEGAPAKTTLYDKLNQLYEQKKVDRMGAKGKKDPYRFRRSIILPSDSYPYRDGKTNEQEKVFSDVY